MSLERVIKALISLGLSRLEAEVYVYTTKKGQQTVEDLNKSLNYSKNQINTTLKNLTIKRLVTKSDTVFSGLPFEEALELLIEKKKEQAKSIEDNKKELLVSWEES
jgi:sugar-specific transcriptional regulator TrmB